MLADGGVSAEVCEVDGWAPGPVGAKTGKGTAGGEVAPPACVSRAQGVTDAVGATSACEGVSVLVEMATSPAAAVACAAVGNGGLSRSRAFASVCCPGVSELSPRGSRTAAAFDGFSWVDDPAVVLETVDCGGASDGRLFVEPHTFPDGDAWPTPVCT